jgi:ubiquinone/menaquinone biosynthesis C-methylase UbiE
MSKLDADDRWIVDLLQVQPADRVLDVGCGPGVFVSLAAERATAGLVCGVDPSTVMLDQAAARNQAAVQAGRVELRQAGASALPYPDGSFTKVCSMHSMYFWPSVEAGLQELSRVLAPGGRLAIAVRMRREGVGVLSPSRYGYTDAQIGGVVAALGSLGLREAASQRREIGHEIIVAITAHR